MSYLGTSKHIMANIFKQEFSGFDFVCAHGKKVEEI